MQQRAATLVVGVLVAWFELVSCSPARPSRASIRIGTFSQAIDYAPFYVAKHFKWFEGDDGSSNNAPTQYVEFQDRDSIATAFDRGELAAVFSAEPPAIISRAQGNDIRIVGVSCTLQQEIIVRRELPVNSALDLRGRRVAVLQGTSSHYGLLRVLSMAGLAPDRDVKIEYMGPGDAKKAFEGGAIDAWAVWPPFIEEQQVSGRGRILTGGDAVIQSVMSVPSSDIKNDPALVKHLVATLSRAKQWIIEHPEEAQSIVATQLGINLPVVKAAWSKHRWESHLTEDVIKDIEAKAQFLQQQDALRRPINVRADLIDQHFEK